MGEVVGIKIAVDVGGVKAALHQKGGHAVCLCRGGIVAETAGIGDHARIKRLGGCVGNAPAACDGKGGDESAAAFKGGVGHLAVGDLFAENVVIEAGSLGGSLISLVADECLGRSIENDSQSIAVLIVGNGVALRALNEGVARGHIAHGKHRFFGVIVAQDLLESHLTAEGIAVGIFVAVDDNGVMRFDQLFYLFKHVVSSLSFIEIALVFDTKRAVREKVAVQFDEVIVRHAGDIIDNNAVGLIVLIGDFAAIVRHVDIIDVMAEDGGALMSRAKIVEQLPVDLGHHGLDGGVELGKSGGVIIDHGIVIQARLAKRLEMFGVKLDIRLAVAVFDDIDHKVVDDLGIDRADAFVDEHALLGHLGAHGILSVLAEISDDVRNADHAALKGTGHEVGGALAVEIAFLDDAVELFKAFERLGVIFLAFDLAVVAGDAVQRLQADVVGENTVQHANGVNVVEKMPPCMAVIKLVEIGFARVTEGRVSHIVPQRDGLDQIKIQMQNGADGAGNAGNQLHMKRASCDIVIFTQGEDLCFVGVAVVIGAVHDLVDVMHKGGAPDRRGILGKVLPAANALVVKSNLGICAAVLCAADLFSQRLGKCFKIWHGFLQRDQNSEARRIARRVIPRRRGSCGRYSARKSAGRRRD